RTELGHIEEWLRQLALARPQVELRLTHNGKPSRRWKGEADLLSDVRLHETLGPEVARHAMRVDDEGAGLRVHGWIARPGERPAGAPPGQPRPGAHVLHTAPDPPPSAGACGETGVLGRGLPRPPAGVCAVPRAGSTPGRRERASCQA